MRGSATGAHALSGTSPEAASLDGPSKGVEANARLTGMTAALLLVLLAAEGVTVLRVGQLLSWHAFIGLLLVPPIALKVGSTGYRFVRYYSGAPGYRRKGPPLLVLRVLGPLVIFLTVCLFASGIALLFTGPSMRSGLLTVHRISFFLWFAVMVVHVLGHLVETGRLAPKDFLTRTRGQVQGANTRLLLIGLSVGLGVILAFSFYGRVDHFRETRTPGGFKGGPPGFQHTSVIRSLNGPPLQG
jgi:hypothetical protein